MTTPGGVATLANVKAEVLRVIVEKRRVERFVLLNVEGVIKLGESAEFLAQTLERTLEEEEGDILLDLSRINYIDSTGIGELVGFLGRLQELDRRLVLINPNERIRKLLYVARLDSLFPVYESLDEALVEEGKSA